MNNLKDELREKILTCVGPFDIPHRCSSMHCDHCGLCDASEDIIDVFLALFESYVKACKPDKFPSIELPYDEHTYEHGFNNAVDVFERALLKELKG